MNAVSVRDYRNNLASYFAKADSGESVLIRRKNQIYTLVNVGREDLIVTPELQARIDEVERAAREGKCVTCATKDELNSFLDAL